MTVVSGLNCNIYNLSVNHGILYCSCRHKRSSPDLRQFRSLRSHSQGGSSNLLQLVGWRTKFISSLKRFLWIFWLWPLVPSMYQLMEEEPGLDSVHTAHDLIDLDYIATSSPMQQFEPGEGFLIGEGLETGNSLCCTSLDLLNLFAVGLISWTPDDIAILQVWSDHGKKQFWHCDFIQACERHFHKTQHFGGFIDCICDVTMELQLAINGNSQVFLPSVCGKWNSIHLVVQFRVVVA